MHSSIIQISAKVISHDKFLRQDDLRFAPTVDVDYVNRLHGMTAVREIEAFSTITSVRELLSLNSNGTLTYKGNATAWLKKRIEQLKTSVQKLTPTDIINPSYALWQIRETFNNPLGIDTLFVIGNSNIADGSIALLRLLTEIESGSKLYIGSVFDYHF